MKRVGKEAVWKGVIEQGSMWAYCDMPAVATAMDKVLKNYGMYKKWANQL